MNTHRSIITPAAAERMRKAAKTHKERLAQELALKDPPDREPVPDADDSSVSREAVLT
jgi:hypothetical protein